MCAVCNILNNKFFFMNLNIKQMKFQTRFVFSCETLVKKDGLPVSFVKLEKKNWCFSQFTDMCVSIQDVITATFAFIDFWLFVLGVVGNAIVIYVISSDKKLKNKSNYHILSVAVADFIIALPGIPLSVVSVSLKIQLNYSNFIYRMIFSLIYVNCRESQASPMIIKTVCYLTRFFYQYSRLRCSH